MSCLWVRKWGDLIKYDLLVNACTRLNVGVLEDGGAK